MNARKIYRDICKKYPEDIWQDEFPLQGSLEIIINKNAHLLKTLITDEDITEAKKNIKFQETE